MELKEFYIYVYLDQRKVGKWVYNEHIFTFQPFYIGFGSGYRDTAHLLPSKLYSENSIKNRIIKKIKKLLNQEPIHYRIYTNLSKEEAITTEKDFIKKFGKIKNKTGILSNITDGGEGNKGLTHTELFLNTLRKKVYQYSLDGSFIKEWRCLKDAQIEYGDSVKQAINKKGTAYNFQWRYEKFNKISEKTPSTPSKEKRYKFKMIKNNETIKIFNSFKEVQEYFKKPLSFGNISEACNKKRLKTYLGYEWEKFK